MASRRLRQIPEIDERDLEAVPLIVLATLMALFDHLEGWRPLLDEEQSTRETVSYVRDARNQLMEERFGRGMLPRSWGSHPSRQRPGD